MPNGSPARMKNHPSRAGLTRKSQHGPLWTGEVRFNENWLMQPLKWKRPRRIFVVAHGDLFHESVPDDWIGQVMEIMNAARHHTYQVLTKRPDRMASYLASSSMNWGRALPHVQWGTSVEDQESFEVRWWLLRDAAVSFRWLSMEPLLGPIRLELDYLELDWVVVGGESGPGARPMHPQWARDIRDQCVAAGVPFHFKQWGEWYPDQPAAGGDLGAGVRAGRVQIVHPTGQTSVEVAEATGCNTIPGSRYMSRYGKKRAGRMLDGRTWDEMPVPPPESVA